MLELKDLIGVSCGEFYHEEDDVDIKIPHNITSDTDDEILSQEILNKMCW